jgi:hypothetical protein
MATKGNVFIEQLPNGTFAVRRPGTNKPVAIKPTQAEAIGTAAKLFPGVKPDIERVRHTKKGNPDQWRKK